MRMKFLTCLFGFAWAAFAWAQTATPPAQTDTLRTPVAETSKLNTAAPANTPAANAPETHAGDDFELETIEIQAVVEKPNVDIIPKRTKPEWEETRFIDRSFEAELKRAPKDLMLVDEELDRAQKLEALKKVEAKKKP